MLRLGTAPLLLTSRASTAIIAVPKPTGSKARSDHTPKIERGGSVVVKLPAFRNDREGEAKPLLLRLSTGSGPGAAAAEIAPSPGDAVAGAGLDETLATDDKRE
jgi:hypothetical protein